jgi:mono/diheme cytochrome c family protein
MTRRGGVTIVIAVLAAGCSDGVGRGWDWNRMRVQPKVVTYGEAAALPGRSAMQLPPTGTVPFDTLEAPVPTDSAWGAQRYRIFCAICHGPAADGQSLIATNMAPPKPPSLLHGGPAALADAALDSAMVYGFGTMAGFGGDLPAADRRAIASYIRGLQHAAGRP